MLECRSCFENPCFENRDKVRLTLQMGATVMLLALLDGHSKYVGIRHIGAVIREALAQPDCILVSGRVRVTVKSVVCKTLGELRSEKGARARCIAVTPFMDKDS